MKMVIFNSYVSLPEGISSTFQAGADAAVEEATRWHRGQFFSMENLCVRVGMVEKWIHTYTYTYILYSTYIYIYIYIYIYN